jgi:N-carbamoylputrescine amidase
MLIAAIQTGPPAGSPADMVGRAFDLLKDSEAARPDLVVFPELFSLPFWCVGLSDPKYYTWAESVDGQTVSKAAEFAKDLHCHAVVPFFERGERDGEYYNSAAVVGPHGDLIAGILPGGQSIPVYRKNAISSYNWEGSRNDEKYYFRVGPGYPVFQTEIGTLGVLICYDRWFPEAWRMLALQGVDIVAVPNASAGGSDLFQPSIRTWAAENIVYVVATNRAGSEVIEGIGTDFYGMTCVASPRGRLLASAEGAPGQVVAAHVDLDEIRQARFDRTMYRDRRPELYGLLGQP